MVKTSKNQNQTPIATLDKYMILKTLGVGRTARIELATNKRGKKFALKVFKMGNPYTN